MNKPSIQDAVADRLVDLELQALHGDVAPDLRGRVREQLARRPAGPARALRWPQRALVAAVLAVGVSVVWAVAKASADVEGQSTSASPAVLGHGEAFVPQGPPPEPVVVASLEELRSVPAACRSLHWRTPTFAPDDLARLRELRVLHLGCAGAEVDAAPLFDAEEALAMVQRLPKLLHVRLERSSASPGTDLGALAVVPNLRRLELVGGSWSGHLAGLAQLTALETLEVDAGRLAAADLEPIRRLVGLRRLRLDATVDIDPEHLVAMLAPLERLTSLALWDCYVDSKLVEAIASQRSIVELRLVAGNVTAPGQMSPLFAEPRWRSLQLGYGGSVGQQDLENLLRMSELRSLGFGGATTLLHHWTAPPELWRRLKDLGSLRELDVSLAPHIGPKRLADLAGMPLRKFVMSRPFREPLDDLEAELRLLFPDLKEVVFADSPRMGGRKNEAVDAFGGLQIVEELPPAQQKRLQRAAAERRLKRAAEAREKAAQKEAGGGKR
ncbi:MAG: hypothetical protein AB8H80_05875 [Planctomycetota bacterium]